jgi:glycosyltransferase involved in cell wall biosynthesis
MAERLRILQVNTSDAVGGAHRMGLELHRGYRARRHGSWLAVGMRRTDEPDVLEIPNDVARSGWTRACTRRANGIESGRSGATSRLAARALRTVADPVRWAGWRRGHEDFTFPGTWSLLDLPPEPVDIVHCHNLHGGYFDLRALPMLSGRRPLVLTLRDAWLLSGHCAHSFDCDRWKAGCGSCPDLGIYPPIPRDATARNWRVKKEIFSRTSVHLATPCDWLMKRADRSLLGDSIVDARVLPNGVDRTVFHPGPKDRARAALGLPPDAKILLFGATGARSSRWRDFDALRDAAALVADALPDDDVVLVALGESAADEAAGSALVRSLPYTRDDDLALHYRAADLYVHPALADTFPNSVLEALASGTPVVATAVGGIPEQVSESTGALVATSRPSLLADAIMALLTDPERLAAAGERAVEDVERRFDLQRHVSAYLDWYGEILEAWTARQTTRGGLRALPRAS